MSCEEELEARRREWLDAVNTGDAERYADLVSDDVVWMPPGQDAVVGRTAFRDWVAPFLARFTYEMSISEVRHNVAGEWAVEKGLFNSRMTPRSGDEAMEHAGSYTLLWKRESDGRWRIERYIDDTAL